MKVNTKQMGKALKEHLPGIFTGVSMVFTGITVGLGIYEGMKLKEEISALPDDAETATKIKTVARRVTPVVATGSVAAGCAFAAHKESSARILAAAGTVAALKADKEDLLLFKEKAENVLGVKDAEKVKKEVAKTKTENVASMISARPFDEYTFHDKETGFIFKARLMDVVEAQNWFNEQAETQDMAMSQFYEKILGTERYEAMHSKIYDDYGVGPDLEVKSLRISYEGETGSDMSLGYALTYDNVNLMTGTRIQTVGGYVY